MTLSDEATFIVSSLVNFQVTDDNLNAKNIVLILGHHSGQINVLSDFCHDITILKLATANEIIICCSHAASQYRFNRQNVPAGLVKKKN